MNYTALVKMLQSAAELIKTNRDYLSKLDAATGDGDHGTAMFKVANAITATIESHEGADIKPLLKSVGWAAMSTDAGSTSPLYGSLFTGMSDGVEANELTPAQFVAMLDAGVAKLRKNSRAEIGGKTMIDALVPAMEALHAAIDQDQTIAEAMLAAAEAAKTGAASTKEMKASFGRAKNIGDRSIGHVDPGATSMALFFEGMQKGMNN